MSNLNRFILADFLGNFYFAAAVQTLFLFAKGLSFSQIMLCESALLLASVLFEVPTGILGDKVGKKWSIALGKIVILLSWIPWFLGDSFWPFVLAFFIGGIGYSFQSGSNEALIYDDLKNNGKEKHMQKIMGRYYAGITLGVAIAALIGGYIAMNHTIQEFYTLYAITVLFHILSLIVFLTVQEPRQTPKGEILEHKQENAIQHFLSSAKHLFSERKLRRIALLALFTQPFSFVLIYLFQPYFELADVPTSWFGSAVFLASLATIATKFFSYKIEQWFGVEWGAFIASALPGAMWIAMAFVFHPILSVIMYILTDAIGNMRDPIFADYTNRHIESHNRATVISTIYLLQSFYMMLARPLVGLLVDIDLRYACIAMGSVIVCAAIVLRITEDDVTARS